MNATFKGTDLEARELLNAIAHNCACPLLEGRPPDGSCAPHRLLQDQPRLDGLLASRRRRTQLLAQEFTDVEDLPG